MKKTLELFSLFKEERERERQGGRERRKQRQRGKVGAEGMRERELMQASHSWNKKK